MNRTEFMDIVYDLLKDDPDNNRANEIINVADEYAESMAPVVSVSGKTFMIEVSKEEFDKIKRVIVSYAPWCRTFYEEGGEAHWIKSYTPDDGEVYECDNCGVTWQFTDGGPEENEAFYCPKCGFKMEKGEADG